MSGVEDLELEDRVPIPPPLPLYNFPKSFEAQNVAPPLTGFSHSLPIVRHRVASSAARRGTPLREPLQDPRRGLHLSRWFHERDNAEFEASRLKKERDLRRKFAEEARAKQVDEETAEELKLLDAESSVAQFLRDTAERKKKELPPEEAIVEPPTRRLVYDSADPDGKSLDRRLDDLEFDSWFESGNLRAAWRVENRQQADAPKNHGRAPVNVPSWAQQEYDLLCNKDTHTNGHVQWFYFSIKRHSLAPKVPELLRVRLNIVNMMKKSSLYDVGMLPVGFCEKSDTSKRGWTRVGADVAYFRNSRTYPKKKPVTTLNQSVRTSLTQNEKKKGDQHHYTLTFLVAVPHPADGISDDDSEIDEDVVYLSNSPKTRSPQLKKRRRKKDDRLFLAHCFPYSYSDLRNELIALDDCPGPAVVRRRRLCSTLAGNDCELLTITNFLTRDPAAVRKRAGVVLTARVHPGESNASFMMRGCIEFLCSQDPRAIKLRDHFVFKVVPMLNPDGVINGNYRSSLAGEDLNRRYASPSPTLQPTVYAIKQLLKTTHETRGVLFYCDMHGHSRKKNVFFYGCSEAKMAPPPPYALTQALSRYAAGEGAMPPFQAGAADGTFSDDHKVLARVLPRIANNLNGSGDLENAPAYGADWSSSESSEDEMNRGADGLTGSERKLERKSARKRATVAWSNGAAPCAGASGGALFSFRDNSFSVQASKKSTGRVVAWKELGIANSFTLEASFCSPGLNEEQDLLASADKRLLGEMRTRKEMGLESFVTPLPASLEEEPVDAYQGRADAASPVPDVAERLAQSLVDVAPEDARRRAMELVQDRGRAPPIPKGEVELRAKCIESWERDGHYTVEDLQLVGTQLCLALYHYCNLDCDGDPPERSHAGVGYLVQPRLFDSFAAPLLDYGVVETEAARAVCRRRSRDRRAGARGSRSAAVRSRAELELRAVLNVQKRGLPVKAAPPSPDEATAAPAPVADAPAPALSDDEDGLDEFLPSDVDPGAASDASVASVKDDAKAKGKPKKPRKKSKKWLAAKQKALDKKERRELSAAEKVVAKLQKNKQTKVVVMRKAVAAFAAPSESDSDASGRRTSRVGGDSGSDSDPSADDDPAGTQALLLEVTRRRAALAAAKLKGDDASKSMKALKRAARAAKLALPKKRPPKKKDKAPEPAKRAPAKKPGSAEGKKPRKSLDRARTKLASSIALAGDRATINPPKVAVKWQAKRTAEGLPPLNDQVWVLERSNTVPAPRPSLRPRVNAPRRGLAAILGAGADSSDSELPEEAFDSDERPVTRRAATPEADPREPRDPATMDRTVATYLTARREGLAQARIASADPPPATGPSAERSPIRGLRVPPVSDPGAAFRIPRPAVLPKLL